MEPKNHPIEKENHLPNHHFQVPCQSSMVYPTNGVLVEYEYDQLYEYDRSTLYKSNYLQYLVRIDTYV